MPPPQSVWLTSSRYADPFCVKSEGYVWTSVKFMRSRSGRVKEQIGAIFEEGDNKIIAVNGYWVVAIKGVVKNGGSGETQLIRIDETVCQFVAKPKAFIDDEDVGLSVSWIGICCRRRYDWNVTLGSIGVCVVRGNVTNTSCEVVGYQISAERTCVGV